MKLDRYGQMKPTGPKTWLQGSDEELARICPFSPVARDEDELAAEYFAAAKNRDPLLGRFEAAFVGYVEEGEYRSSGSSGGMVTWVAAELLRLGLVDCVAHVKESDDPQSEGRLFHYSLSRNLQELQAGAKSRYYPVELSGVLQSIREAPGRYAVVGIPCFIKAVRLACADDRVLKERIAFTLGLFCGHMKSARMAESFAWQMGQDIRKVKRLDYRKKTQDRPANWYRAQLTLENGETCAQDWWDLVDGDWGAGFFQNSACNFCDDVVAETADIAFGDAWKEPYSSDGRGTNVVIVRSNALLDVIHAGIAEKRIALSSVDSAFVVATQAAGFRQRREGLAFRLSWPRMGMRPRKRVRAGSNGLSRQRMAVYIMRYWISFWSHRVFAIADFLHSPRIYILWARAALACYQGIAYSRGPIGRIAQSLGLAGSEGRT
ncbi:coenzyme F420-reducing hydrogenase beta subunit [Rhizobium aethiopicum]|uniref:Coenzyme F420-reducing hydrogenase beta subunit n=1 Tax=Rhizobium aethiopicum TaxID=1138170 RepID=A0A7W6VSL8_9HYPH|nr:Coenzyme F420 hydrogenase/dehydrogenase, beta subunit C-terminal domain [Rhizobium aethiopicum]MBB4195674.1 coenzyme F420-reducing hydrogenase beta subunit [Rhizobium aethiopicum]MBB4583365.1 coenzyme F420-reducing hydrogenase beta subunit [Rhizobium aethiopicum]